MDPQGRRPARWRREEGEARHEGAPQQKSGSSTSTLGNATQSTIGQRARRPRQSGSQWCRLKPFDRVSGRPSASVVRSTTGRARYVSRFHPPSHVDARAPSRPWHHGKADTRPPPLTRRLATPRRLSLTPPPKTVAHPQRNKKKCRRDNRPPRPAAVTSQPRCPGSLPRWRVAGSPHW